MVVPPNLVRLAALLLLILCSGCAMPSSGGSFAYPPGAFAADGRPIWHRCATLGPVTTSMCSGPAPDGYAEER